MLPGKTKNTRFPEKTKEEIDGSAAQVQNDEKVEQEETMQETLREVVQVLAAEGSVMEFEQQVHHFLLKYLIFRVLAELGFF